MGKNIFLVSVASMVLFGCATQSPQSIQEASQLESGTMSILNDMYKIAYFDNDWRICQIDQCPEITPKTMIVVEHTPSKSVEQTKVVIYFEKGSLPKPGEMEKIRAFANLIKEAKRIEVFGYTDSTGAESINRIVANKRVKIVVDKLISLGADRSKIVTHPKPLCCYISNGGKSWENKRAEVLFVQ